MQPLTLKYLANLTTLVLTLTVSASSYASADTKGLKRTGTEFEQPPIKRKKRPHRKETLTAIINLIPQPATFYKMRTFIGSVFHQSEQYGIDHLSDDEKLYMLAHWVDKEIKDFDRAFLSYYSDQLLKNYRHKECVVLGTCNKDHHSILEKIFNVIASRVHAYPLSTRVAALENLQICQAFLKIFTPAKEYEDKSPMDQMIAIMEEKFRPDLGGIYFKPAKKLKAALLILAIFKQQNRLNGEQIDKILAVSSDLLKQNLPSNFTKVLESFSTDDVEFTQPINPLMEFLQSVILLKRDTQRFLREYSLTVEDLLALQRDKTPMEQTPQAGVYIYDQQEAVQAPDELWHYFGEDALDIVNEQSHSASLLQQKSPYGEYEQLFTGANTPRQSSQPFLDPDLWDWKAL